MKVYLRWRTENSIIRFIGSQFDYYEERLIESRKSLALYGSGKNPFKDVANKAKHASPPFSVVVNSHLSCLSRDQASAMKELFVSRQGCWLPAYGKFTAAGFWACTLDHHRPHASMSLTLAMSTISDCLYLGWLDRAELLIKEAHSAYNGRRFFGVTNSYSQPLYHFLLRICFDWLQLKFDGWGIGYHDTVTDPYAPGECLGEPVLNELFAHWKDSDLSGMQDKLQWLCDYYTHRTAGKDGMEFGNDLLHTRFPALILSWFRLRESLGLNNPIIDHPLMRPHYVYLPPPQPFYTDELLDCVIARLRREELPGLGIVPALVVPKNTSEMPKRNLLTRLLGK